MALTAHDPHGTVVLAWEPPPDDTGPWTCRHCNQPMHRRALDSANIAPHFAHTAGNEHCTATGDNPGPWHTTWQHRFQTAGAHIEVPANTRGPADIVTPLGQVIEVQDSPITPTEMDNRAASFGELLWIFNTTDFIDATMHTLDGDTVPRIAWRNNVTGHHQTGREFTWHKPRTHHLAAGHGLFWDIGDEVWWVRLHATHEPTDTNPNRRRVTGYIRLKYTHNQFVDEAMHGRFAGTGIPTT